MRLDCATCHNWEVMGDDLSYADLQGFSFEYQKQIVTCDCCGQAVDV